MSDKGKMVSFLFFLALVLALTIFTYQKREGFSVSQIQGFVKDQFRSPKQLSVKFSMVTSLGTKQLRIKFSVPCKDLGLKRGIMKSMPRIKNDLFTMMSRPKVVQSFEQRDFKSIKKYSLQAINKHSSTMVDTIYLEYFFLN